MTRRIFLTKTLTAAFSDPVEALTNEQNRLTKERNKLTELLSIRSKYFTPFGDAVAMGWFRRLAEIDRKCGDLWEQMVEVLGG